MVAGLLVGNRSRIDSFCCFIWKLTHKPKPEIERLTEQRRQYHFSGKLNAYFLRQPQEEEEIPPLTFQMNRVKDGRVSLGELFGEYPVQAEALQLNSIFLIADENRSIITVPHLEVGCHGWKCHCMQAAAIQHSFWRCDLYYLTGWRL